MAPRVSIITPWLDHPEFIADYEEAVKAPGVEVIVVDSSAIIAILLDEPDAAAFLGALASATDARISAVTNYEIRTVAYSRGRERLLIGNVGMADS